MTIGELKRLIADMDETLPVILSKDVEGNGFSPLVAPLEIDSYSATNTWSGERGDGGELALFLYPTN